MPSFGKDAGEKESQREAGARQKWMESIGRRCSFSGKPGLAFWSRSRASTSRGIMFWRGRSTSASGQRQDQKRGHGPRRLVYGESEQTAGENA